jgi:hypothetical protein
MPSLEPSLILPSSEPSYEPSSKPSWMPSSEPFSMSSSEPSYDPSSKPSLMRSSEPSSIPSSSSVPSAVCPPQLETFSNVVCQNFAVNARTTVTFDGVQITIHFRWCLDHASHRGRGCRSWHFHQVNIVDGDRCLHGHRRLPTCLQERQHPPLRDRYVAGAPLSSWIRKI